MVLYLEMNANPVRNPSAVNVECDRLPQFGYSLDARPLFIELKISHWERPGFCAIRAYFVPVVPPMWPFDSLLLPPWYTIGSPNHHFRPSKTQHPSVYSIGGKPPVFPIVIAQRRSYTTCHDWSVLYITFWRLYFIFIDFTICILHILKEIKHKLTWSGKLEPQ